MKIIVQLFCALSLISISAYAGTCHNDDENHENEDRISYSCETYTDGGVYKLYTSRFYFNLISLKGEMEVKWENELDYSELPRFRHGACLYPADIKKIKKNNKSFFEVISTNQYTENTVKLLLPTKAEVYGRTMGEIHINDESFEVQCMLEVDIY